MAVRTHDIALVHLLQDGVRAGAPDHPGDGLALGTRVPVVEVHGAGREAAAAVPAGLTTEGHRAVRLGRAMRAVCAPWPDERPQRLAAAGRPRAGSVATDRVARATGIPPVKGGSAVLVGGRAGAVDHLEAHIEG